MGLGREGRAPLSVAFLYVDESIIFVVGLGRDGRAPLSMAFLYVDEIGLFVDLICVFVVNFVTLQ